MEAAKKTLRIILLSGRHKTATVSEIAQALKVSDSLIYQWCDLDNGKRPTCEQVLFLAQYLLTEHGDTRLAGMFLPSGWEIVSTGSGELNGSLDDELAGMVEAAGRARHCFNEGDYEAAETAGHENINLASRMIEEIRAMEET